MRCLKCNWTAVSFDLGSRTWRCKRCHAVVADSGGPGFAGAQPPMKRTVTSKKKSPAARATAAPRAKSGTARKSVARPKAKAKAKTKAKAASRKPMARKKSR